MRMEMMMPRYYSILSSGGMKEGRQAKSTFDVRSYRLQYADLRRAYGNDLKNYYVHYINWGAREGRRGTGCNTLQNGLTLWNGVDYSAVYDYSYYISKKSGCISCVWR